MTASDTSQDLPTPPDQEATSSPRTARNLGVEAGLFLLLLGVGALFGLLLGQLWHWLAPTVPMHADTSAVYLNDPEGEQAIGADGTFALLGLASGLLTGSIAYLATRARQGGVGVALGLAGGALLGDYVAWGGQLSRSAYQAQVLKLAKSVPTGHTFHGPLELTTKAVLMVWPIFALLTLVALTALFTPRPTPPAVAWEAPPAPVGTVPGTVLPADDAAPGAPGQPADAVPRAASQAPPQPAPQSAPQPSQTPGPDGPETR